MTVKLCKIPALLSCDTYSGSWLCTGARSHFLILIPPPPATCLVKLPQAMARLSVLHLLTPSGMRQWYLKWWRQFHQTYTFPSNTGYRKLHKCFLHAQIWKWGFKQNGVSTIALEQLSFLIFSVFRENELMVFIFQCILGSQWCSAEGKLVSGTLEALLSLGRQACILSVSYSGGKYSEVSLAKFHEYRDYRFHWNI